MQTASTSYCPFVPRLKIGQKRGLCYRASGVLKAISGPLQYLLVPRNFQFRPSESSSLFYSILNRDKFKDFSLHLSDLNFLFIKTTMRFFSWLAALPLLHVFAQDTCNQKKEFLLCCQPQDQRVTDLVQLGCYGSMLSLLLPPFSFMSQTKPGLLSRNTWCTYG